MNTIYFLDLAGTLVFAISGTLTAASKKFDIFGAAVIAFVTAVGGGTLRDLLLGATPVFWMTNMTFIYVIAVAASVAMIFRNQFATLVASGEIMVELLPAQANVQPLFCARRRSAGLSFRKKCCVLRPDPVILRFLPVCGG